MMWQKSNWTSAQLAQFSGQLRNLLQCGLPLTSSVGLLMEQKVVPRHVGQDVMMHLHNGASFSVALHRSKLPAYLVSMVAAAEQYGNYELGLEQCEKFYLAKAKVQQEIIQACMYPLIILVLAFLSFGFLVGMVLPRFKDLYGTLGIQLPQMTQVMFVMIDLLQILLPIIGSLVVIFAMVLFLWWLRSPQKMQYQWEKICFRLPIMKEWMRLQGTHYLALQLGSLLQAGVPLLKSMELIHLRAPWQLISNQAGLVKQSLLEGKTLEQASQLHLSQYTIPTFTRYLALAEQTGRSDETLYSLGKIVEAMMKQKTDRLTKLLEPLLISTMGIVLAFVVISLFLPMLQMVQAM